MSMKADFLTWAYDLVTQDGPMIQICTDVPNGLTAVQLFLTMADKDTIFPYQIYDFSEDAATDGLYPLYDGRLTFSVWDWNRSKARAVEIASRLKAIFENRYAAAIRAQDGSLSATAVRIRYYTKIPVPTGREDVWREDVFFSVRLWDQTIVRDVLARTV